LDKYSKTYRWLTPARLRLATTSANQKQSSVSTNWAKNAHNNRFALLASDKDDDETDKDDSSPTENNMALPVLDQALGKVLKHSQLRHHPEYKEVWDRSYTDKLGQLCQGIGTNASTPSGKRTNGTNTLQPIQFNNIPADEWGNVAQTKTVCKVRLMKEDPNRTRITIGGNSINYPDDCGTKTGLLELVKLMINSVCSWQNARFMTMDLGNFDLGTLLDCPEYICIKLSTIPQEFIEEYNLLRFAHNRWVFFECTKRMYGLK
jgi:hypothetical protein